MNQKKTTLARANQVALDVLVGAIVFLAAIMMIFGAIALWQALQGTVTATVQSPSGPGVPSSYGGVELTVGDSLALFSDAPTGMRWLAAGQIILVLLLMGVGIIAVVKLRSALTSGRPFAPAITTLLGVAAVALLIHATAGSLLDGLLAAQAHNHLAAAGYPGFFARSGNFSMQLNVPGFLAGLVLGLIAGVFEVGARMQRETEGLI